VGIVGEGGIVGIVVGGGIVGETLFI
jgi:hypothetical protein